MLGPEMPCKMPSTTYAIHKGSDNPVLLRIDRLHLQCVSIWRDYQPTQVLKDSGPQRLYEQGQANSLILQKTSRNKFSPRACSASPSHSMHLLTLSDPERVTCANHRGPTRGVSCGGVVSWSSRTSTFFLPPPVSVDSTGWSCVENISILTCP